ncbi:major capsid protein [Sigmofec virus UA08Rod_5667]|uniref:Major capsid protein n=1 Tax=Sigmofec virus UA08Rod_5667 TaxID=2929435 RepID=A0A976N0P9_9VIRU|nr:major capsid protein [Sigmofec virus UA08Rod_5667]
MTRNTQTRFALNPTRLDMSRSRFNRSSSYKTTFNVGDVVPFYVDEVLPGDTFDIRTSKVVRMQTLLTPMMDNIYLDTYFFFVPNRLTWSHWRELMGENSQSAWVPTVEYSIPQVTSPDGGWQIGTIADYMGIPTGVSNLSVSALPFRAYALICNEWFRDENLLDPFNIPVTDANIAGSNGSNYITDCVAGGKPFRAAKYHDYFTSALPAPQKGPDVTIQLGQSTRLPVISADYAQTQVKSSQSVRISDVDGTPATIRSLYYQDYSTTEESRSPIIAGTVEQPNDANVFFNNLWAVNDGSLTVATINQLRTAFQIQKLYERDARGGTRYIEILKSHFGVTSPDARLQRPEYLGGSRVPININQVVQSSSTESNGTPQGNTTAYSLTTDSHHDFTKSFVEHGFVIGLMVARYDHSYQQGIERFWSRKDRFDFYWPVFANLGEQAILNKEIFAQGNEKDDEVFGYQECWADYRYKPSRVTGEMRSSAPLSLDSWHLADDYQSQPFLSASWITESSETVDRVLAVSSRVSQQLFCDFYIKNLTTRPMPLYSIPGLVDHH